MVSLLIGIVMIGILFALVEQIPVIRPATRIVIGPSPVIQIRPREVIVVSPQVVVVIEPPPRAVWDEKGWERRGDEWSGFYDVTDRSTGERRQFEGLVVMEGDEAQPYIEDPPAELSQHPRSACFQRQSDGWFLVNWSVPARNVDEAIIYVEQVLSEAINGDDV